MSAGLGAALAMPPVAVDAVALAIVAALAAGTLLLAIGSLVPATAQRARPLWPILLTELVIVLGAVLPVLAGGLLLDLALALLAARVGYEAVAVAGLRLSGGLRLGRAGSWVAGLATAALALGLSGLPLALVATGGIVALALAALAWRMIPAQPIRIAAELAGFPLVPLVLFVTAARQDGQASLVLLAFLLVETYDSYALLGGKLFGRRPAFPRLSPRKTVEGLLIGGAMLALTALVAGPLVLGWSPAASLGAAILIAATAIAGDLAGSRLKRASGVKDYPLFLPRQGGLLDIVDAWLIAAPALVMLAALAASAHL